jgi:hypothetical protein
LSIPEFFRFRTLARHGSNDASHVRGGEFAEG